MIKYIKIILLQSFIVFIINHNHIQTSKADDSIVEIVNNNARTSDSCWENMFIIKWIADVMINLEFTIYYTIEIDNNQTTTKILPNLYKNCLKHVSFSYLRQEGGGQVNETYELSDSDNVTKWLNYTLKTNFQTYSTYSIYVGYEQKDPPPFSDVYVSSFDFLRQTCSMSPGLVENATLIPFQNGSYLVEWQEPSYIGAPSICYYTVEIQNKNESVFKDYTTIERRFYVNSEDVIPTVGVAIRINAVNNHSCYAQSYPSFNKLCWDVGDISGNRVQLDINPIEVSTSSSSSSSSITSLSTTLSNSNSAQNLKLNLNILFVLFLFFNFAFIY